MTGIYRDEMRRLYDELDEMRHKKFVSKTRMFFDKTPREKHTDDVPCKVEVPCTPGPIRSTIMKY